MPRTEGLIRAQERYAVKRPTVTLRLDGEVAGAVVAASTDAGVSRARWIEEAVEQRLAREGWAEE